MKNSGKSYRKSSCVYQGLYKSIQVYAYRGMKEVCHCIVCLFHWQKFSECAHKKKEIITLSQRIAYKCFCVKYRISLICCF